MIKVCNPFEGAGHNTITRQQERAVLIMNSLGTSQFAATCAAQFPPASIRYAVQQEDVLEGEAYIKTLNIKKGNGLSELDELLLEVVTNVFSLGAAFEINSAGCSVYVEDGEGDGDYHAIDIKGSMKRYTKHQVPQFLARCVCEAWANASEPVAATEHAYLYADDSKSQFLFQYYTGSCLAFVIATDGQTASVFIGKYSRPKDNRKTKGSLAKALLPLGYQVYQPRTKEETPETKRTLDARAKSVASIEMERKRLEAIRNRAKK